MTPNTQKNYGIHFLQWIQFRTPGTNLIIMAVFFEKTRDLRRDLENSLGYQ